MSIPAPAKKPDGCEPCSWPECGCQYSPTPAATDDLIERLRNPMWAHGNIPFESPQLEQQENLAAMNEAAAEIERLRGLIPDPAQAAPDRSIAAFSTILHELKGLVSEGNETRDRCGQTDPNDQQGAAIRSAYIKGLNKAISIILLVRKSALAAQPPAAPVDIPDDVRATEDMTLALNARQAAINEMMAAPVETARTGELDELRFTRAMEAFWGEPGGTDRGIRSAILAYNAGALETARIRELEARIDTLTTAMQAPTKEETQLRERVAELEKEAAPVEEDDETIARRLAIIFHGDDVEWKGFLTKAHHWMSLSIDAADKRSQALECSSAGSAPVAWTNEAQLGFLKDPNYALIPMAMWAERADNCADVPLYRAAPQEAPVTVDLTEGQKHTLERIRLAKAAGLDLDQFWLDFEENLHVRLALSRPDGGGK